MPPRSTRAPRASFDDERQRMELTDLDAAIKNRRRKKSRLERVRDFVNHPFGASAKPAPIKPPANPEYVTPDSPWFTKPGDVPLSRGMEAVLRFALHFAVLAPSSHNTQPWKFKIDGKTCRLFADRAKALPVTDPDDRELTISCGCALFFLRLALRRFGFEESTRLLPAQADPNLLATVTVGGKKPCTAAERKLFDAIPNRRTTRLPFAKTNVPPAVRDELIAAAAALGATLVIPTDADRRVRLARLIHEADVVQLAHRPFRRELAMWLHHNRTKSLDGIPGYTMGLSEIASIAAPLVVRTFDVGDGVGARDEQLALHSPLLLVLGTDRDRPADRLAAGQALAAVLLCGTQAGLTASYLNQPVELPETRSHLQHLFPEVGWPQIILRMGIGPKVPHTPRHPVDDVILH